MKIDRLIGILSILLQKETVTAPALAEQFEISRRTISRDIDTLPAAALSAPNAAVTGPCAGDAMNFPEKYSMRLTVRPALFTVVQ